MANPELLEAFLASSKRPAGTLSYHGTQGFLFAVMAAPELIPPSEWVPLIFDDDDPSFADDKEASDVFSALVDMFNAGILGGTEAILPVGAFREDPMANLAEDAPLSQWAQGFIRGFWWLEDVWEPFWNQLSEDLGDYWVFILTFFASRAGAEEMMEDVEQGATLESTAARVLHIIPEVAADFLEFWQEVYQEQVYPRMVQEGGTGFTVDVAAVKTGSLKAERNAPCDCGSGKAFRECCGREMN
ncbi:MAG: UPF0149 family protein [Gemmatimonadota bacterium]|nr:UPF0149 family protein [Gemmatimonadota bacterium]